MVSRGPISLATFGLRRGFDQEELVADGDEMIGAGRVDDAIPGRLLDIAGRQQLPVAHFNIGDNTGGRPLRCFEDISIVGEPGTSARTKSNRTKAPRRIARSAR